MIISFWIPEYIDVNLVKIRAADVDNLVLCRDRQFDCVSKDFGMTAERVLCFKTWIHVYEVADHVEERARTAA